MNNKAIAIVGTTASGKTNLAVGLACRFAGEIVSADSRQVYKYNDIACGKDIDEYSVEYKGRKTDVPYHLIDIREPKDDFTMADFYRLANGAIKDILKRDKLPIVAGGTGLYTQALVDGYNLVETKPDMNIRKKAESMDVDALLIEIKKMDADFFAALNESEKGNKRRLTRYYEVLKTQGKISGRAEKKGSEFEFLLIGITWPREVLRDRIYKRLVHRIEHEKMVEEIRDLHEKHAVSWEKLESLGLEFKFISYYLRGKMDADETVEKLSIAIGQFAKRQLSWLRRWEKQGVKINWVKTLDEAEGLCGSFLN